MAWPNRHQVIRSHHADNDASIKTEPVQDCSDSSVLAMEMAQYCINHHHFALLLSPQTAIHSIFQPNDKKSEISN